MLLLLVTACFCILLFLYIRLRQDIRELLRQLTYARKESSTFTFYITTSHHSMKQLAKELNLLKEEMQLRYGEYVRHEKNVQDMMTNISHDIRTPLTSIQGYLEMLKSCDDKEIENRYFHIVENRLHDLEVMLDEFFLYTKITSGEQKLALHQTQVYPLVCSSLLSYMDLLKEHDLAVEVQCSEEGISALLHEESFRRICTNLIMNTIRYGKAPFRIRIQREDTIVVISFENEVLADHLEVSHLFDRFYKGDQARNQLGNGLGLAIVKELSEAMQGEVSACLIQQTLQINIRLQGEMK